MAATTVKPGARSAAPSPAPAAGPAAAGGGAEEALSPYRWIILVGLLTAAIMEVLDTTIINVALPQMAGNLGATAQEIGWVSTGYILSNVVVLPMTAWLAGRFGRKRYLTFSIALFIVASFFCGTSGTLGEIVFWRIVQGAGGAALLSTAQATLRQIFPRDQQGIVQSLFLLGIVMAPTLGPTLGGWITDNYSWSWVFFINLPIGLASMFLVSSFLTDPPTPPGQARQKVDWLGIVLLAVGLGSLQYVLEEGNADDWFQSATILNLSIVAGVCITGLLVWELWPGNKNPIVNLRVLKNRDLAASLFLFLALGFGLYGGVFLFPIFAQNILHFTPTETGLVLLPGGIATGIGSVFCGRVLNGPKAKVDPRFLILFGMALFMVSMWDLGHLTTQSGIPDTRFALIVRGFGLGFLFAPINLAAFNSLKGAEIPQGSGLVNLTRQLGGSFGIAIIGTYLTNHAAYHRANLSAHINLSNPAVQERQQAIIANLVAHGMSPAAAKNATLGILSQTVGVQAQTMAFDDAFLLILAVFVFVTPAVLLLRKPKAGGGAAAGAGH